FQVLWPSRCRWLLGRGRREAQSGHERDVRRPVFSEDVRVATQVQITRVSRHGWKEETDLWAEGDRSTPVVAELGADTSISGDLLIDIADQPGMNALADKLRGCPVGMEVDAIAIIQRRIGAAEAEAGDHRKLLAGLRVEVGVAATGIDRDETGTQVGKAGR